MHNVKFLAGIPGLRYNKVSTFELVWWYVFKFYTYNRTSICGEATQFDTASKKLFENAIAMFISSDDVNERTSQPSKVLPVLWLFYIQNEVEMARGTEIWISPLFCNFVNYYTCKNIAMQMVKKVGKRSRPLHVACMNAHLKRRAQRALEHKGPSLCMRDTLCF